ncbi:unnamed protein product [Chrysoparadoxa australica]
MGIFEGLPSKTLPLAVHAVDKKDWQRKPPQNNNGTPNESVADVLVRVRQLMCKLETQFQGEDIILVSPDSDCLR